MRKAILLCGLLVMALMPAQAQNGGSRLIHEKMKSSVLGAEKNYTVYLPAGYDSSGKVYPVLYLLHGAWGDHTSWVREGNAGRIADQTIAAGFASEMIIVMPDASGIDPDHGGKHMGYFNMPGWAYEDFFFKEFIPYIEKAYRIRADKQHRAIAGLSMGGGGTTVYAQRHPDIFGSACSLSGLLSDFSGSQSMMQSELTDFAESVRAADAVVFVKNATPQQIEQLKGVRWYFDCGDDDYLYEGNLNLYMTMRVKQIPLQFRMRDGGHTWEYWQSALPTVLQFISIGFAQ